ncbi:hypothetical protein R3P38DRAFT_2768433 [Favolaschia claudopus]|uniref:Uncharacterized protein n=1 Tax=Favolaschia claudopus TaxID=2862362 RepID=A0AAW0CPN6_9AGAR
MPSSADKENPPRAHRKRTLTSKLRHTREAQRAAQLDLTARKHRKARRQVLRARQAEDALIVERPNDSDEVRQLRASLARARGERDAAEAATGAQEPTRTLPPSLALNGCDADSGWTARPRIGSGMTFGKQRQVRRFMDAGLLQLDKNWKGQDSRQLLKIYDAIEDVFPPLKRCTNHWAAEFLVHDSFSAQKTYESCKEKEGTYRFRTRRNRRERASSDDDDDSGSQGSRGPLAPPSTSPSPEPSGSGSGSPQQTEEGHVNDRLPSLTPAPESE